MLLFHNYGHIFITSISSLRLNQL